jgi:arabinogalactan endo-1,4-beta-galactosidase
MKMENILLLYFFIILFGCKKGNDPQTIKTDPNVVKIANSSFETVGASNSIAGWNTLAETADLDAVLAKKGSRTGSFCLAHIKTTKYKVYTSQELTGLDTGYYSLYAWVRNSGGQNSCYLSAKDYGDNERMTSLPVSSTWTQVIVRGIHVTNNKCKIGFYSDALAGNWSDFDDVKMLKDGQLDHLWLG